MASLLSEAQWKHLFPKADAIYTRDNFLKAVAKFPGFCGKNGKDEADHKELC